MNSMTRREMLKAGSAAMVAAAATRRASPAERHDDVPVWEIFEHQLSGPAEGNPFMDVTFGATFSQGHREVFVDGFYDGNGIYKVRFMPDTEGEWRFRTVSNAKLLEGHEGIFHATAAKAGVHGPVRVANRHHFSYADGTPYFPFGTTCYAWTHQGEELQQQTLATLKTAPFNKIRMCVFPKHYEYNHNEPPFYPFPHEGKAPKAKDWKNDYTRFQPEFFAHLEKRIGDLRDLEIEADLILFHPYDRWGYQSMPADADDRYLRHVLARLSSYRNIWWSLANEFDLMKAKKTSDFDRMFHIVEQHDPYRHLRSIHFSVTAYDYSAPWVSHGCLQLAKFDEAPRYLADWQKPVLFDEVQYEGNLDRRWGNISGDEMARRCWQGVVCGCYVSHGETLLDANAEMTEETTPTLWWSHGGKLKGSSPAQIAFLRRVLESSAQGSGVRAGIEAPEKPYYLNGTVYATDKTTARTILYYFDDHQPIWYEFPLPAGTFRAEMLDPQARNITTLPGTYSGKSRIRLTGRPFQAIRFVAIA